MASRVARHKMAFKRRSSNIFVGQIFLGVAVVLAALIFSADRNKVDKFFI